jgi:uncharacterized membrane protein YhaH (DUF805 family)
MNRLFSFDRRINRATYFAGIVLGFAAMLLSTALATFISMFLPAGFIKAVAIAVAFAAFLAYMFYALCLTKQRANDISGANATLYTILGVFILSVIIGVISGENQKNRYGGIPQKGVTLR